MNILYYVHCKSDEYEIQPGGILMIVLVTGCTGFIGFHLSKRLVDEGHDVIGIDSMNDYYDVSLKEARLNQIISNKNFIFKKTNLLDHVALQKIFDQFMPEVVINLGAQAGVRYSLENPQSYVDSNITGFLNILEHCKRKKIKHLIYASSSSVYGMNTQMPFMTGHSVDHPISIYAATKRTNELFAHTYSYLYDLPTTGLRFFTVYGPWGRPDMALFLFTKAILNKQPIQIFNNGNMLRDFTYINDIVEAIVRLIPLPPKKKEIKELTPAMSTAPFEVFNIGNQNPVKLTNFIEAIEKKLNMKAIKEYMPLQPGDVPDTIADVGELYEKIGFRPETSIEKGVSQFIDWYLDFYK